MLYIVALGVFSHSGNAPLKHQGNISQALMEAWVWLEREGLIAPKPGEGGDWVFITRRGRQLKKAADLQAYRKADLLPRHLLHPIIAQKVRSTFLRGDYDTAVFQAFKEVEVAVRNAGGFALTDIGTKLMRKAFAVTNGPMTDPNLPEAEQQAWWRSFLFLSPLQGEEWDILRSGRSA